MKFFKDKKELLVIFLFLFIAGLSFVLSAQLPKDVGGDEVVVLLFDRVKNDVDFPDHSILSGMTFNSYLYPKLIGFLDARFPLEAYRSFLLFVYVFFTGWSAYLSLRLLKVSRSTAIAVALIALMPRVSPGSTFFGVFTNYENLGRSMALPIIWLLAGVNIKLLSEKKKIWWLFLLSGVLVYVHPISIIFFTALMLLISFVWILRDRGFKQAVLNIIKSIIAFSIGAFFLIKEIVTTSGASIGSTLAHAISGDDYAKALLYRMPWDFPPETILWLRQTAIISFIFILFILFVWYFAKKKNITWSDENKKVFYWSGLLIVFSIFFSYLLPNLQLYLVRNFDWPFIVQQSSRMFKFYYLGVFLILAVCLDFFRKYFKNKLLFTFIVIIGIVSSSIGFEFTQYLWGFDNYQSEYIPVSWQQDLSENKLNRYQNICKQVSQAGITANDLVISNDFDLRYFCEIRLLVTYEEGTIYMMRGRESAVYWHEIFQRQAQVLDSGNADDLIDFAQEVGAQYAILSPDSQMIDELETRDLVANKSDNLVIIKF